jgi:nucleoside-diphosphate-sugar epimerase
MLIPGLIQKIKNKQIITLDGDQGIKVNPIYVADASRCLPCLISEPVRGVFNLSGPEVLSLKQICDTIGKEINVDPLYQYSGKPALDLVASTKKMKTIGFSPNIHFKETLKLIL